MVMKKFVFPHMLVVAPDNSSAWRLKEGRELCPSNLWWPLRSTTRNQQKADSTVFPLFFCVFSRAHMTTRNKVRHHTAQTTTYLRTAVTFLLAQAQRQESTNSRSILITPVENQEGVWLSKKVLLVQLVGAQLHGCNVLREQTDRFFFSSLRSKSILFRWRNRACYRCDWWCYQKKKQPIDGDANADGNGGRARSGDGLITDTDYSDGSHSLQFKWQVTGGRKWIYCGGLSYEWMNVVPAINVSVPVLLMNGWWKIRWMDGGILDGWMVEYMLEWRDGWINEGIGGWYNAWTDDRWIDG